jgi:hypothetical protein
LFNITSLKKIAVLRKAKWTESLRCMCFIIHSRRKFFKMASFFGKIGA